MPATAEVVGPKSTSDILVSHYAARRYIQRVMAVDDPYKTIRNHLREGRLATPEEVAFIRSTRRSRAKSLKNRKPFEDNDQIYIHDNIAFVVTPATDRRSRVLVTCYPCAYLRWAGPARPVVRKPPQPAAPKQREYKVKTSCKQESYDTIITPTENPPVKIPADSPSPLWQLLTHQQIHDIYTWWLQGKRVFIHQHESELVARDSLVEGRPPTIFRKVKGNNKTASKLLATVAARNIIFAD